MLFQKTIDHLKQREYNTICMSNLTSNCGDTFIYKTENNFIILILKKQITYKNSQNYTEKDFGTTALF